MDAVKKRRLSESTSSDLGHSTPRPSVKKPKNESSPGPSSDAELSLEDLVDFSTLTNPSQATIQQRFEAIAKALLCDNYLVVVSGNKETKYEILELEFYLWMDRFHEDPFTHGSEEQKIAGQWYFHRAPRWSQDSRRSVTSTTAYRDGSRKGLDLTIGRAPSTSSSNQTETPTTSTATGSELKGGALLRSIRRVSTNKVTSGPSLLVDELLKSSNVNSIPELVSKKWDDDISAFHSNLDSGSGSTYLCLKKRDSNSLKGGFGGTTTLKMFRSPRIGLELSHSGTKATPDHPRLIYLSRPYRYFVHPKLLDKGRAQTFLGVLRTYQEEKGTPYSDMGKKSKFRMEVMRVMNMKENTMDKYFIDFLDGVEKGDIKSFVGSAGKGASSSPATYLKMMGSLEKFMKA
ncbi:hypothetical protein AMATHDRAFT_162354 [Amanita thiersii Skay4041]|uniref:Uncharacterized protein n=1 Tax=Amanita thiersii Skay4041 TaxID=703135 RepID=A0A2A9N638_9AGAR|nr:hypothetical protein AMATHDRAFT_162354 [Amanita thiersii Skay4041]